MNMIDMVSFKCLVFYNDEILTYITKDENNCSKELLLWSCFKEPLKMTKVFFSNVTLLQCATLLRYGSPPRIPCWQFYKICLNGYGLDQMRAWLLLKKSCNIQQFMPFTGYWETSWKKIIPQKNAGFQFPMIVMRFF